jgi:hypothetical protein
LAESNKKVILIQYSTKGLRKHLLKEIFDMNAEGREEGQNKQIMQIHELRNNGECPCIPEH